MIRVSPVSVVGKLLTRLTPYCMHHFQHPRVLTHLKTRGSTSEFLPSLPTPLSPSQVVHPFDYAKFNFTKAYKREALFQFEPTSNKSKLMEAASASSNLSVVLINISPIEFGHVLLVPHVNECLQQV